MLFKKWFLPIVKEEASLMHSVWRVPVWSLKPHFVPLDSCWATPPLTTMVGIGKFCSTSMMLFFSSSSSLRRMVHKSRLKVVYSIYLKSVNLQYNTLGRLDDGTNKSSTKRLMFPVFFFHDFLQNSLQKSFQFTFLFLL